MKRVLYVEHNTDGTVGGSHLCLLEICRAIDRARYQPVVCFFQDNALVPAFREAGVEVHFRRAWAPAAFGETLGVLGRLLRMPYNVAHMLIVRPIVWLGFLRRLRIDLVHLNNACGFDHDLMLAARLAGIPCVIHERGIEPVVSAFTRFFANRVAGIVAISDAVRDNLLAKGIRARQLCRIDDGIDPSRLVQQQSVEALRRVWGVMAQTPVIGIVGNIKCWKGQETVIRAAHRLKARFPALRCFVVGAVGDPEYKAHLDAIVRELQLHETVVFTGFQARPTDLMALFDVCVHASVEPEPFGIVILEAMGKAKPVVATNIGAPREIVVEGETGFCTPPGDAAALAERLERLLIDAALRERLGRNGDRRLRERYTARRNVEAIESLYTRILPADQRG